MAAEGTGWFITKRLVLAACLWRGWDERLQAGGWVNRRRGQGAEAVAARANMTPAQSQRSRLDALPAVETADGEVYDSRA